MVNWSLSTRWMRRMGRHRCSSPLGGDVGTGIGQVQLGHAAARPLRNQRLAVETSAGTYHW